MPTDRSFVPSHHLITEVGHVHKDFVDRGGTVRSVTSCLLQIWVADGTHHRLPTTTLATIMEVADAVLGSDELPVEVDFEDATRSQYPLAGAEATPAGPLFHLGMKHTACLALEKCGVGGTGCC